MSQKQIEKIAREHWEELHEHQEYPASDNLKMCWDYYLKAFQTAYNLKRDKDTHCENVIVS